MHLRTRFCLVLAAFSVILTIVAVALTRMTLVTAANHSDRERARAALDRGMHVLSDMQETVFRTVKDWSSWDDTYAFIADRNQNYIDSNLVPGTLETLRMDVVVCLDTNRQIAAFAVRDAGGSQSAPLPDWLSERLQRSGGIVDALQERDGLAGFLLEAGEPWLVAAAPILSSADEGPARGTLLMARHIDTSEQARLSLLIHPSLTFSSASRGWPPGDQNIQALTPRTLQAQTVVAGLCGDGRLLIGLTLGRDAFRQSSTSLWFLTGWIVACAIAISLFVFFVLHCWVLRSVTESVEALRAGIAATTATGTGQRPQLQKAHADEIGELVDAVDATLEAFEASAREADRRRTEAMQTQKLAALGTLVAGMAHEINNPNGVVAINVTVIRRLLRRLFATLRVSGTQTNTDVGTSELARVEQELDDTAREILTASERIAGLVASLKAFAQPAPADLMEPVDVGGLTHQAAEWIRHELTTRQCRLECEITSNLPRVRGISQQILQVLINLLQNACNAVDRPDSLIRMVAAYDAVNEAVTIRVADNGIGIAQEDIEHVLDPFFTTRRAAGGTGLGLSISAAIVRAHGGSIRIESSAGTGTVVTVTLPARREGADAD